MRLQTPSQSARNPTTWFQLGIVRDAGPEIRNGLGAFLYAAASEPGLRRAFFLPNCHDELSMVEVPIATAWRAVRRSMQGSLSFLLGMAIAAPNAMPSPRTEGHRNARRGFTLLEIMVVIALLSLLATAVAVAVLPMLTVSEDKQAQTNAAALAAAAEAFIIGHGSEECPTPEEMQRDGVLSSRSKTEDPWGTPYRIVCEPDSAIAISAGRDRTFDTGDDVKSDEP
jgi:general secretion pathway protein G